MMGEDQKTEHSGIECSEELLQKLLHLKRYEMPDSARLMRSRQNIMREVRNAQQNKRQSLFELVDAHFPWFFAEPKYGVAMLFLVFAGLQYLGINARHAAQSDPGIYVAASAENMASVSSPVSIEVSNQMIVTRDSDAPVFSELPDDPEKLILFEQAPSTAPTPVMVDYLHKN